MKDIAFTAAMPPSLLPTPVGQSSNAPPAGALTHHAPTPPAEGQLTQVGPTGEHQVDKVIRHEGSKWVLHFSDGRKETFSTEEKAKAREKQVNYFKHRKK